MKILKILLLSFARILLVIYIVAVATLPSAPPNEDFAGIEANYNVEIIRDEYGVPHIYGQQDKDVAFGLAYAHAQDDLATIEDVLLATRGLMSTKLGFNGIPADYLVKFMDVNGAVDAGYDSVVSDKAKALAEAYANGLNHYISQNNVKVSPYLMPITGKDIVAGYPFKTPLFYGFDKIIAKVYAGKYGERLVMEGNVLTNPKGIPRPFQTTRQTAPDIGSQGIAIAPKRSGGDTLLLINSHQPLSGPVAWYETRLKSNEGWDMVGATFPGAPLILHGAGRNIGWSSTVNKPDLADVYQLTVNEQNHNQYMVDGQWLTFGEKKFDITVHFLGPIRWTFEEKIKQSIFGPVLQTDNGYFAINWAGRNEVRGLDAHYAMNKAKSLLDFEDALRLGALPSINYIVADSTGQIAHYYNAMFPKRNNVNADWKGLLDGTDSSLAWSEYLAYEKMPKTVNPSSGAVYNANNTPFESTDGNDGFSASDLTTYIGIETHMTNRATRIKRLLKESEVIDYERFREIKYDGFYDVENEIVQAIYTFLAQTSAQELAKNSDISVEIYANALAQLRSWDLNTDLDNRNAALGVLTIYPFVQARFKGLSPPSVEQSFIDAVAHLIQYFATTDIRYSQINKLYRGEKSWSLAGGPDVLRAVYGQPTNAKGELSNTAGDSYIMFARWNEKGDFSASSVHSFGSATLDKSSPHFDDQVPLFVEHREKPVILDKQQLLLRATEVIRFGQP